MRASLNVLRSRGGFAATARDGESVRGIFVVAGGDDGQVLVNVVGDISPENIKQLTSAATKIGLENGLDQALKAKFHSVQGARSDRASPEKEDEHRP